MHMHETLPWAVMAAADDKDLWLSLKDERLQELLKTVDSASNREQVSRLGIEILHQIQRCNQCTLCMHASQKSK